MYLTKQERSKRLARLATQIISLGVISRGFQVVEIESATCCAFGPSFERKLVVPVLYAHLQCMLRLNPRQVIGKLPTIIGEEAKSRPCAIPERCVGYVSE